MSAGDKVLIIFDAGKRIKQHCGNQSADPRTFDKKIRKPEYGRNEQGAEYHDAESRQGEV